MIERLETERLILRPLTMDDVDQLVALDADPAVMRYINGGQPTTRSEMEQVVRESLGHRWLALDRPTGAFVGWLALRPSPAERIGNSATACCANGGVKVLLQKVPRLSLPPPSPSSEPDGSGRRR